MLLHILHILSIISFLFSIDRLHVVFINSLSLEICIFMHTGPVSGMERVHSSLTLTPMVSHTHLSNLPLFVFHLFHGHTTSINTETCGKSSKLLWYKRNKALPCVKSLENDGIVSAYTITPLHFVDRFPVTAHPVVFYSWHSVLFLFTLVVSYWFHLFFISHCVS